MQQEEQLPTRPAPLWRNRDFVVLWSGQTLSTAGSTISDLALPLLVLALTGSAAQTGFTLGLETLPYLIFGLPAGAWVDRWNRKKVMILCDSGRALTLVSIPIALAIGHLTIVQLYLTSFIEGTLFVFFNIAAVSSIPRIVPKQQLTEAYSSNYAAGSVASIIGQPVSTFLFFGIGRAIPFLVDAVSYGVSVVSLLWMRTAFQQQRSAVPRHLRKEIQEGLLWLWKRPLLRYQAFLGCGLNFVFSTITLFVVLLAQRHHALPLVGIITAIGSVGGILGALFASPVQKRFSFGQVMIGTFWILAFLWPLYAIAPNPLALGIITFGLFFTETITSNVNIAYRLALVPDELQGRVNSVHRLLGFGIGRPLGLALAGVLSQDIGVISTVFIFFAVWLFLAISTTLNVHVRNAPGI